MPVLDDYIELAPCGGNVKRYEDLGYILPKHINKKGELVYDRKQKIKVKIEHISRYTKCNIRVKCDQCGFEETRDFRNLDRCDSDHSFFKTGKLLCNSCVRVLLGKKAIGRKRPDVTGENNWKYKHGSKAYSRYMHGAKDRGLEFDLSIENFKELTKLPCFYCNRYEPLRTDTDCLNGIDRVDNSEGYNIKNCVPCCGTCNQAKMDEDYLSFVDRIKTIYFNLKSKGLYNET